MNCGSFESSPIARRLGDQAVQGDLGDERVGPQARVNVILRHGVWTTLDEHGSISKAFRVSLISRLPRATRRAAASNERSRKITGIDGDCVSINDAVRGRNERCATYRREIMSLLAEWRDAPNPN
jgi:hypothetical protein